MSDNTKRIVTIVLIAVAAAVVVGGLTYYLQQRRIDQMTAQITAKQAEVSALASQVDAINARLESQAATEAATGDATTAEPAEDSPSDTEAAPKPEPTTSRQFALVKKATDKNGKVSLVLDFAQFLTGNAAADAAAAAGDESPPPNDYYISNANPKLRTFPVAKKAKFVIAFGDPNDTATLSASEFQDAIANNTDGAADAPYWFVITNGVVTGGEQQWLP